LFDLMLSGSKQRGEAETQAQINFHADESTGMRSIGKQTWEAAEPIPHPCTPKRARPARFGDPALAVGKPQARDSGWQVVVGCCYSASESKEREIVFKILSRE
jgi:hypothetical protein